MKQRAAGFTLIEVMITVFVVAVGLLSVAGLQALSKKSNFDAIQRTQAAVLAQDLIERMRANPGRGADYLTDATEGISSATLPAQPDIACTTSGSTGSPRCTPAQVVDFDRYEWSRALFGDVELIDDTAAGGLSEPTACVTNAAAPCGTYTVAIAWRGITPLPPGDPDDASDPASNPCGQDNAAYDDPSTSGEDARLRRLIVLRTVIDDHSGQCLGSGLVALTP
ncbi:type IV pilus modification protein PilV [Nevskia sp.]|uniref:type IV pilus modification protein PilV n=1 Tax=Nevskia sp. TaxID=1929292 RepID=UPI0025F17EEA|nr:type IV pilus modification protein PilV [Nevskia sp.]